MILRAIEMECVGPFSDAVRIGPFASGLNVLAAPNESGKTTALQAAARALFDRHTTKSRDLKLLQPAGTELSPRIAVEFEAHGVRYRIEKTFLQTPRSVLRQWQDGAWAALAEADAADRRVRELLASTLPGNGPTRPEHWGMLGFLWARQGEPAEWPGFGDEGVGQDIRARLAQVEIDPVIERLRERLSETAKESFTGTGQRRKGGPLDLAESELEEIDVALADLAKTRADLQSAHERHERASLEVVQLEREHAERTAAAATLSQQAAAAERGQADLRRREVELASAQTSLDTVAADAARLASLQEEFGRGEASLEKAEGAVGIADSKLEAIRKDLGAETEKRPGLEVRIAALRTTQQRTQALLRLRRFAAGTADLSRLLESAEASGKRLTALKERRAKLPAVTPKALSAIERDSGRVRTLAAQVEALGLSVELTPEESGKLEIDSDSRTETQDLAAGEPIHLQSPQSMDLRLVGWGRIRIRSGATEAREIAEELEETERRLKEALEEAGVDSLETAREAVSAGKQLDVEIEAASTIHAQQLGEHESLDRLREALAISQQREGALTESLVPTTEESGRTVAALEAAEVQCGEALPAAEAALREFDQRIETLRGREVTARAERESRSAELGEQRIQRRMLETQIADLKARYPLGIGVAKANAQTEFVKAEARVTAARAELPPEFEKLPERNRRAAAALQQLANDLQARRAERDSASGALETLGGQGIYSRETELEERKAEVRVRRDAVRDLGWSARIASDLIEFRKQAATRSVLAPLEERLTVAFAELTGNATRRVFLDDSLQIDGVGRTREARYPFDSLSQGAREQLLLCLRLAVAGELASEEPQVLILDDVLVNTDAVRQERILDTLGAMSDALQILVLTCHPERYRGIGGVVEITRSC